MGPKEGLSFSEEEREKVRTRANTLDKKKKTPTCHIEKVE